MRATPIHAACSPVRAIVATVMLPMLVLATASDEAAATADVRTAMTPHRQGDLVKTIPISKRPWQETRSAISLGPAQLGTLKAGEVIEAAADIQTTICIRPNPNHPGGGQPCVGRYYSFDPRIKLKLVLAPTSSTTAPGRTVPVGRTRAFECTERPGHRTRHCVQQVPFSSLRIGRRVMRRCTACHLNLLVSAHHPRAGRGHQIVLGGSDDRKRISQGRSQLSAVVHPASSQPRATWSTRRRVTRRPSVVAKGRSFKEHVIYSQKVSGGRRGEQLLVEARAWIRNNGLPYPTHQHFSIVISKQRSGTRHVGKIAERGGPIAVANGFTCTQVSSGHQSPCGVVKSGIVSVKSRKPFFINLVSGAAARGTAPEYGRWRGSHRTEVLKRGRMKVRKFRGTMSCETCAVTRGFEKFSASRQPRDARLGRLVAELGRYELTAGALRCRRHSAAPRLRCAWRSLPGLGCVGEAIHTAPGWRFEPCVAAMPDAVFEQLWRRGDSHDGAGCELVSKERIVCWFAANFYSPPPPCMGQAVYLPYAPADRRWSLTPCPR